VTELEQIRAWSYRRQHLDRSAVGLMEALEQVLAVHSTHPPAPLSLLARTPGLGYDDFESVEREKLAISLPVMRGSVHLLPTSFAPEIFAATSGKNEQLINRRLGSDPEDSRSFDELREALLPRLDSPVAGSGIRETLGISEREFLAIRLMTRTGEILRLSTNPRSDRLMYVGTAAWLGAPLERVDAEEARRWLAKGYFEAFGPARVKDFAWWFSASQKDARAAIEGAGLVDIGDGLLLPASLEQEFSRTEPLDSNEIAIIPKWDSYTMGYAPDGRQRFVDDGHLDHAYTTKENRIGATTGDGLPLILRGGRAVARWSHRFSGKTMTVDVAVFPGEKVYEQEIASRLDEVAELMACQKVGLSFSRA
jgi:hypothetical protein